MQIKRDNLNPTTIKLTVTADQAQLDSVKVSAIGKLGGNLKLQGFRPGKAPIHLIEKQLDSQLLQSEVLETAVNQLYVNAIQQENLRPVAQPKVSVTKFVPFTTLEVSYEAEVIGEITLPDLSKLSLDRPKITVTSKDVDAVLENLRERAALKEAVSRVAKNGDEVTIDFKGTDAKTKEPIAGADGKDYPLILGSNSFIPGFEAELVGLKTGEQKDFAITFPADYNIADLQKRKVSFAVTISKVQKLTLPKLDDSYAASVGPFTTVAELKADIKKQLTQERQTEAERDYENRLLELIATKTKVEIPEALIDEEIERIEAEEKRNIVYRGQTWQEHLDQEGVDEAAHREKQRPNAQLRVKAGLVLGQIAENEKIVVTPEELEAQILAMKQQYQQDPAMLAELDKPDNRRDVLSRILSQKSLDRVKQLIKQ